MQRSRKGKAIVRFLTAITGIPMLRWDGETNVIDAPPPYYARVSTDASSWRFWAHVKELPRDRIAFVVRYDSYIESVDDAVVGVRLSVFAQLLEAHYNTISDRITTFTEGD